MRLTSNSTNDDDYVDAYHARLCLAMAESMACMLVMCLSMLN